MTETSIENICKIYSELYDMRTQQGQLGWEINRHLETIAIGKAVHEGRAILTVKGIEDVYMFWDFLLPWAGVEDTGFESWEDIVEAEVTVFDDEDQDTQVIQFPIL